MKITDMQQRFANEYVIDLNATQAAIRAGYTKSNASVLGYQLLQKPSVQAAISTQLKKREDRTHISQDRVLLELSRIAFFDPRKLFNAQGMPIPINELDDDTAAALAGMDVMEEFEGTGESRVFVGYTKKYKVSDKNTALTNAMRHLGMLNEKLMLQGDPDAPIEVNNRMPGLAEALAKLKKRK